MFIRKIFWLRIELAENNFRQSIGLTFDNQTFETLQQALIVWLARSQIKNMAANLTNSIV